MADATKQLKEKTCPMCGKNFIFRNEWAYKTRYGDHVTNYCSWTCLRKRQAEELAKKKKRQKVGA